jgi:citrate synthase
LSNIINMSDWVPVDDALALLGVQRQTLYAYVSRGLVRARPDADDPRRSLYAAADLARLKGRRRGARRRAEVAASAIAWGEPVLESAISTVRDGRLIFRGMLVEDLAKRATLEEVASLLWQSDEPIAGPASARIDGATPKARAFNLLARRATQDAPTLGRNAAALCEDAWRLLPEFADALTGVAGRGPVHLRLAKAWKADERGSQLIRRMLVLMADHELNPSTFAVRIAASTGAPLAACALAGLSTLAGPLHGEAASRALAQLDQVIHQRRAAGFDFVDGWGRRGRQGAADRGRGGLGDGRGLLRLELVLAADEILVGHQAGVSCFLKVGHGVAAGCRPATGRTSSSGMT